MHNINDSPNIAFENNIYFRDNLRKDIFVSSSFNKCFENNTEAIFQTCPIYVNYILPQSINTYKIILKNLNPYTEMVFPNFCIICTFIANFFSKPQKSAIKIKLCS